MCALWQRFGRGARGPGTEAVAIFLVESKYFDEEREKAEERRQQAKKRKLNKAGAVAAHSSALAPSAPTALVQANVERSNGHDEAMSEDEDQDVPRPVAAYPDNDDARRARYKQTAEHEVKIGTKKRKADVLLEEPIDDFINADRRNGLGCRRKPVSLYFNTSQIGTCFVYQYHSYF